MLLHFPYENPHFLIHRISGFFGFLNVSLFNLFIETEWKKAFRTLGLPLITVSTIFINFTKGFLKIYISLSVNENLLHSKCNTFFHIFSINACSPYPHLVYSKTCQYRINRFALPPSGSSDSLCVLLTLLKTDRNDRKSPFF